MNYTLQILKSINVKIAKTIGFGKIIYGLNALHSGNSYNQRRYSVKSELDILNLILKRGHN